ncbi:MAG: NTP transferase domain-containing protein [Terriglobia bacterium]
MSLPAIILCGGESKRMGSPKALLPFRDGTFLSVLAEILKPFCSPVIAVFGADGDRLATLAPAGVTTVVNRNYKAGMLTSLQTGLREVESSRVLFTLVDHPSPLATTLRALIASAAPIAIPRMNGRRGHPVIVGPGIAAEILAEAATAKVRDVIDRHAASIEYIEVNDPGISDDVDDPALYNALLAREADRR